jgi:hypothetical protein
MSEMSEENEIYLPCPKLSPHHEHLEKTPVGTIRCPGVREPWPDAEDKEHGMPPLETKSGRTPEDLIMTPWVVEAADSGEVLIKVPPGEYPAEVIGFLYDNALANNVVGLHNAAVLQYNSAPGCPVCGKGKLTPHHECRLPDEPTMAGIVDALSE